MVQEGSSEQRRKYYRSIQYRSASFDIKPNKLQIKVQKLPVFQYKNSQTAKNHSRKSKRNLFGSQHNLANFNKSLSQSLSKVKEVQANSTIISLRNPEQQFVQTFDSCSYLQSFSQLMQNQSKQLNELKPVGLKLHKLQSIKAANKPDRISLPNIIQYNNSDFTALDPIKLPINGVKERIQQTKREIQTCPNDLKLIKCQIKEFEQRKLKELDEFQKQYLAKVKIVWARLRENSVTQQGFVLRTKRQIKALQDFIPQFKAEFQTTKQNQILIQKDIFQTAPFQLTLNQQNQQGQNLDNQKSVFMRTYF